MPKVINRDMYNQIEIVVANDLLDNPNEESLQSYCFNN